MSLTGPDFWKPEQGGVMPTAVGQRCFRCEGRTARDPAWTWTGGQPVFGSPNPARGRPEVSEALRSVRAAMPSPEEKRLL